MPLRSLSDRYFVSPQITPQDLEEIRAAGVATVICNRPDDENPPALSMSEMKALVEEQGMVYVALPFNHTSLSQEIVSAHRDAIDASQGPVLAYCASGNRSTVVWALGQAEIGAQDPDTLVATASKAGYDLMGLKPTLRSLYDNAGTET